MIKIRIKDANSEGFLSFDLKEILETISEYGKNYQWIIYELDAIGNSASNVGVLQEEICKKPMGKIVTWGEIFELAQHVIQVIDGTFIALKKEIILDSRIDFKNAEIIIRAIDSSYWEFESSDKLLIEIIKKRFSNAIEVNE